MTNFVVNSLLLIGIAVFLMKRVLMLLQSNGLSSFSQLPGIVFLTKSLEFDLTISHFIMLHLERCEERKMLHTEKLNDQTIQWIGRNSESYVMSITIALKMPRLIMKSKEQQNSGIEKP